MNYFNNLQLTFGNTKNVGLNISMGVVPKEGGGRFVFLQNVWQPVDVKLKQPCTRGQPGSLQDLPQLPVARRSGEHSYYVISSGNSGQLFPQIPGQAGFRTCVGAG